MSELFNINDEWANFINKTDDSDCDSDSENEIIENYNENYFSTNNSEKSNLLNSEVPISSEIYISTKTKIAYLSSEIDLKDIFWKIPIINYSNPSVGVIKKQIKFNSIKMEELNIIQEKLKKEEYFEEYIITSINNPDGRIKFKDIRNISIGLSKKDLLSYRCKKKSAFYNCFVLILRIKINDIFKEFHIKIFNTGKLEIPGVQNEETFLKILNLIIEILQPHMDIKLSYKENTNETVLINSNFNCGFFINRETLFNILKYKYNIQAIYDPCSYPGIQCKFYYNPNIDINIQTGSQISEENKILHKNIVKVSFMIFRTGSVLIVGKCDENVLMIIYEFLKKIFIEEYENIFQKNIVSSISENKSKVKKIRKKNILISVN